MGATRVLVESPSFQAYMPEHACFGCGSANEAGLKIKSYWDGTDALCHWQAGPRFAGWPASTCGGIIATLIDCHCIATAMATAIRNENRTLGSQPLYQFATAALEVRYLRPTPLDTVLELRARVTDIKDQRRFVVTCELSVAGEVCAQGTVTAVLVQRSDQKQGPDGRVRVDGTG
jgi:acyl-coenzyme A thioesterase PaaI-like protein